MAELNFPLLAVNVIAPLVGAAGLVLTRSDAQARGVAIAATAGTALLSLEAVREVVIAGGIRLADPWAASWFAADGLNAVPMALFASLALATVIIAPRTDATRRLLAGMLALLAATLASYAAQNLAVLLAGWAGSVLAFMLGGRSNGERIEHGATRALPNALLVAGVASLAIVVVLIAMAGPLAISNPAGSESAGGRWAFFFLILAVVLRNGIFPAHSAAITLIERGPLLLSALFLNAQLGAFLFASVAVPLFPESVSALLPLLSGVALFTAIYTAVLGVVEKRPRRLLGILIVSESANILAGLATTSAEGITGALVHWMVLAVSTTILISVYRSVEVRAGENLTSDRFYGFAGPMPRLAVFFFTAGLAVVGIPFLMGFSAADLLLHGALDAHPILGLALPLATALNAVNIFRLFARLFLGKPTLSQSSVPDALPRERWVLSACLAFLVWGGVVPHVLVEMRTAAADAIVKMITPAKAAAR
jgi:NADH-quinone oxidoreductase subunit M